MTRRLTVEAEAADGGGGGGFDGVVDDRFEIDEAEAEGEDYLDSSEGYYDDPSSLDVAAPALEGEVDAITDTKNGTLPTLEDDAAVVAGAIDAAETALGGDDDPAAAASDLVALQEDLKGAKIPAAEGATDHLAETVANIGDAHAAGGLYLSAGAQFAGVAEADAEAEAAREEVATQVAESRAMAEAARAAIEEAGSQAAAEHAGDPVSIASGAFLTSASDLSAESSSLFQFGRHYDSARERAGSMGPGWRHSFEERLYVGYDAGADTLAVNLAELRSSLSMALANARRDHEGALLDARAAVAGYSALARDAGVLAAEWTASSGTRRPWSMMARALPGEPKRRSVRSLADEFLQNASAGRPRSCTRTSRP